VPELRRRQCRQVFEERFSAERMAKDHVKIYEHVAAAARLDQKVPAVPFGLAQAQPNSNRLIAPSPGLHEGLGARG